MAGLQLQVPHTLRQTNLQGPDGFESDKHSMELRVIWVNGDVSPTQILKHIYIYIYRYLSIKKYEYISYIIPIYVQDDILICIHIYMF